MQLTVKDVELLGTLTTRDESGQHFLEVYEGEWLDQMEAEGLITIDRPVHPATGIPYGSDAWTVHVTPKGELAQYCHCGCLCESRATCADESGVLVCDACSDYTMIAGDVYCSRQTERWTECPICKTDIRWEVCEHDTDYGTCDCGEDRWTCRNEGGYVHRYIED